MKFFKVESDRLRENPGRDTVYITNCEENINNDKPDQGIMANFSLIELIENQILGKYIKVMTL